MNEAIGDLKAKRVSLVAKPVVDNSKKDQDAAKTASPQKVMILCL